MVRFDLEPSYDGLRMSKRYFDFHARVQSEREKNEEVLRKLREHNPGCDYEEPDEHLQQLLDMFRRPCSWDGSNG